MRPSKNYFFLFLIAISLTLFTISCSDDSTSSIDPGEEPSVPEATPYEIDNSMFEDAESDGETESFQVAEMLINSANTIVLGISNIGNAYLNLVDNNEPEVIDDVWVWEFTVEEGGSEVTIRATAEDLVAATEWNIYLSGNFDEYEDLDEFLFATGVVDEDGASGEWVYYSPEDQQSPIFTYDWEADSEDEYQINSTYSFDGEVELYYQKDNAENILEFNGFENETVYTVFWNSDTGEGYYDDDNERNCWDENYQNVDC